MERITPKEVTSMMEAVAQVYDYEQSEVEQVEEVAETELVLENEEYEKLDENLLQLLTRNRTVYRRDPETGQKIRVDQQRDPKNPDNYIDKKTSGTDDYGYRDKKPGESGDGTMGNFVRRTGPKSQVQQPQQPQQRPQSPSSNLKPGNPNVAVSPKTGEETKFERRMPTMAELRAAQAARAKAKAAGASDKEAGYQATKAGVGVAQGTVKDPKIAADANRKAELERIRQRAASQTRSGVRPTVASTADSKSPAPSTTGATTTRTVKPAASGGIGGYQTPASARPVSAVARAGATPAPTPAARPAATAPAARPAATAPAGGAGSVAQKVQAVRSARMNPRNRNTQLTQGDPMERMTGKGAASLMETYSKVYEEREPQAIDEGIMGALAKVGEVVAEEKTAADPGMKERMGKGPKKGGYQLPKRTPENAKNVEYYKDDADLFDIIKGHFIEEGLTEEEAFAKMFDLTDEERTEIIESMASANRMKELEKERLSNRAPSVKYPAKPSPYGGARSREFEKRLPNPQSQKARSREFEHGSTRSSDTPSGNLGDGLPRDKKGNIMR